MCIFYDLIKKSSTGKELKQELLKEKEHIELIQNLENE